MKYINRLHRPHWDVAATSQDKEHVNANSNNKDQEVSRKVDGSQDGRTGYGSQSCKKHFKFQQRS